MGKIFAIKAWKIFNRFERCAKDEFYWRTNTWEIELKHMRPYWSSRTWSISRRAILNRTYKPQRISDKQEIKLPLVRFAFCFFGFFLLVRMFFFSHKNCYFVPSWNKGENRCLRFFAASPSIKYKPVWFIRSSRWSGRLFFLPLPQNSPKNLYVGGNLGKLSSSPNICLTPSTLFTNTDVYPSK